MGYSVGFLQKNDVAKLLLAIENQILSSLVFF